ncbi:MAG TPA: ankyrin repeat domain-containing protein [Candidatus Babeliales bacterium]|nr:ankyrin repeat domain-containing protein [Candidatus Babeliales bacterium]
MNKRLLLLPMLLTMQSITAMNVADQLTKIEATAIKKQEDDAARIFEEQRRKLIEKHEVTGALLVAARSGDTKMVKALLPFTFFGPDVRSQHSGPTALMCAADGGHLETVQCLVAQKANVNATMCFGETPLWSAVKKRHKNVVDFLLTHKADVDATDYFHGQTPVFEAVKVPSDPGIVQSLLDAKANYHHEDKRGCKAYMVASDLVILHMLPWDGTVRKQLEKFNGLEACRILQACQGQCMPHTHKTLVHLAKEIYLADEPQRINRMVRRDNISSEQLQ